MKKVVILNVEDSIEDSKDILETLEDSGLNVEYKRIETLNGLNEELDKNIYDIIIADYALVGFNGLDVLKIVRERDSDIPFIMVSGVLSEEYTVDSLKAGADDFVSKLNLHRLVPSFIKVLREAKVRRESREAEYNYVESEKRFAVLSEAAIDAIVILDENHKITFWNHAATEIFKYDKRDILQKDISTIMSTVSSTRFYDYCKIDSDTEFSKGVNGTLLELEGRKKSGEIIPIAFSFAFTSVEDEINAICIIRDISSYVEIEKKLKASRDELKDIFENIQDVFYRTDLHGNVLLANNLAPSALGYDSIDELIGKNVANDLYAFPEERDDFLKILSEHGRIDNAEVKLKKKNGEIITTLASSHYYYDDKGHVLGVEGVISDITSIKKTEEELKIRVEIEKNVARISSLFVGNQMIHGLMHGGAVPTGENTGDRRRR